MTCLDEVFLRDVIGARAPVGQRVDAWQHVRTCELCRTFTVALIEASSIANSTLTMPPSGEYRVPEAAGEVSKRIAPLNVEMERADIHRR